MNPDTMMGPMGRYEVRAELGRGGMARVYLGFDPQFEREVAIKLLPREFLNDPTTRARFERETKAIAALEHLAIVPVYDSGEEAGQPYLVMRHMGGGSLAQRMAKGPVEPAEILRIIDRIASALDYAHDRGVIHRDIKPGNILFDPQGEAYLSDFGIAKLVQETDTLTGEMLVGTAAYMSPEQAQGERVIGPRSDVYSLGVVLFELLSGRPPYEADTPIAVALKHVNEPIPRIRDLNPDLPKGIEALMRRALAKKPERRPPTAGALASALREALGDGAAPRAARKRKGGPAATVAVAQGDTLVPSSETTAATGPAVKATWTDRAVGRRAALPVGVFALVVVALLLASAVWLGWLRRISVQLIPVSLGGPAPEASPTPEAARALTECEVAKGGGSFADPIFPQGTQPAELIPRRSEDMRRLEEILALSFPTRDLRSLSWSSESRLLAVGTRAGVIVAAVAEGGEMCRLGPYSPEGKLVEAGDVDWSRDGKFLAALGRDQTLRVWGRDGREVFALANDSFGSVEWSPDASQLVATDFGALIVREAGQARPLLTLAGDFSDFAWSPGGNLLAAADADFSLKAFSFPRRLPVQTLTGHENHVTSVAWSADGAWVASGSTDGTVRVWDPVQGTQLSRFEAGWTMAVDWSPAGPFLASGGIDGVVAVWDAERMERIAALAGLPGVVTAVEWSPDGRMLAAAAQDGTVHIWGARPP